MVFKWWPFTKKAPPLHRALGEPQDEETSLIVEELATKGRVRKRDDFKRNALHVAVSRRCRRRS